MNNTNRPDARDYAHAAWCYINAVFPLKNATCPDVRKSAFSDLHRLFQNTLKADKHYTRLCEKVTLLSVINCTMPVDRAGFWHTLIDPRLGLKCADLSGQQISKLVLDNPEMIAPIHITADHLLRFLHEPSEEIITDCQDALDAIGAIQWMNTFIRAITLNRSFNNPKPKAPTWVPSQLSINAKLSIQ